jgi:hypothetical protein
MCSISKKATSRYFKRGYAPSPKMDIPGISSRDVHTLQKELFHSRNSRRHMLSLQKDYSKKFKKGYFNYPKKD